jgi:RNA-binding protein
MIGEAGLTPRVIAEIENALKNHELIKIRVLGEDRDARKDLVSAISEATGAGAVQRIGKMLVFYRPKPPEQEQQEEKKQARTKRPRRNPPRKLKRSYQKG